MAATSCCSAPTARERARCRQLSHVRTHGNGTRRLMRPGQSTALGRLRATRVNLRPLLPCSGRVLAHFCATFYGFTDLRGLRADRGRCSRASGNQVLAGLASQRCFDIDSLTVELLNCLIQLHQPDLASSRRHATRQDIANFLHCECMLSF